MVDTSDDWQDNKHIVSVEFCLSHKIYPVNRWEIKKQFKNIEALSFTTVDCFTIGVYHEELCK